MKQNKQRVVAIIQARMSSTRLPGKVLANISGRPMLWYVVTRTRQATTLDQVVVATSDQKPDDAIAQFCAEFGIDCFRGSEADALDRYYQAAKHFKAEAIVRVTADCPLIDPEVINKVVKMYQDGSYDYVSNTLPCTYPDGLDVEVFSFSALKKAWRNAIWKSEREHVTQYIRKHQELFRIGNVAYEKDLSHMRWTVDRPQDLEFVRAIYNYLGDSSFGMAEVLALLEQYPKLLEINAGIDRDEGYERSLKEDRIVVFLPDANLPKGPQLYRRARRRIPGGTQLLSKRPEMLLPEQWPSYYSRTKGVDVWDLDGNHYIDMSYNGLGSCILGAADPDVDEAVKRAIDNGSMSTLNCPEEVELAELLCELHPWAEMVRYARTGGEAMAIAIRIARAYTGRERLAFCGYHGWHDWYLAANLAEDNALDGHLLPGLEPAGVPRGLRGTALPFHYNRLDELETILSTYAGEVAAVVMEPVRWQEPEDNFLTKVAQMAREAGCVLIFDEITSGFRLNTGGAHLVYNVEPDIAVFGKAIANGYPMAAIIGKKDVMEAVQSTFISSTFWTERIGSTGALATIYKHRNQEVAKHLIRIGTRVQECWREAAANVGLPIKVEGIAPLGHFNFQCENAQAVRTLFTQEMLERGFLATNAFYATYAHTDEHVDRYAAAVREVFSILVQALQDGTVEKRLKGPVAHSGFHRLT